MAKSNKNTPQVPEEELAAQNLLKEADEALRQENLSNIWKTWGSTIIGVALMIIFGTMIGVGWQNWRTSVYSTQTSQLLKIQQSAPADIMALSQTLSGTYKGIAIMDTASQIAKSTNKPSKSTSIMIHNMMVDASDADMPNQYDLLAKWAKLRTQIDADPKTDKIDIAKKMEKLANKSNNPYASLMLLETAIIYGENDNPTQAIKLLEKASKLSPPSELSVRINNHLHLYNLDLQNN